MSPLPSCPSVPRPHAYTSPAATHRTTSCHRYMSAIITTVIIERRTSGTRREPATGRDVDHLLLEQVVEQHRRVLVLVVLAETELPCLVGSEAIHLAFGSFLECHLRQAIAQRATATATATATAHVYLGECGSWIDGDARSLTLSSLKGLLRGERYWWMDGLMDGWID